MSLPQGVEMSHLILKRFISFGDYALDATCGNGHDTQFLAELVGEEGQVLAVDIQEEAVANTQSLLKNKNLLGRVRIIRGDHKNVKNLIEEEFSLKTNENSFSLETSLKSEKGNNKENESNKTESEIEKDLNKKSLFKAAIFNLGFLPGSGKEIITTPETTLPALKQSLEFITSGGVLVIVAYTGHPGGKEECQQVLDWAGNLDSHNYNVLHQKYINQSAEPPQVIAVEKRT